MHERVQKGIDKKNIDENRNKHGDNAQLCAVRNG